jgi:hypothetical protein
VCLGSCRISDKANRIWPWKLSEVKADSGLTCLRLSIVVTSDDGT